MNPKRYPVIRLLLGLAALSGCQHVSTTAERDASFAPYAESKIPDAQFGGEIDFRSYTAFRTALVVVLGSKPSGLGAGSAAAIDGRGYYLTAAHAAPGDTAFLQVWHNFPRKTSPQKPRFTLEEARIVWRGDVGKGEPDLALLYTSRPPELVFEWSSEITLNSPAVSTGLNYEKKFAGGFTSGAAAGKLLNSETRTTSTPPWFLLTGNLPLHSGDSGGPLTTVAGRLLGINYAAGSFLRLMPFPPRTPRAWISLSVRPNLDWLHHLIDEDYAKRSNAPAIAAFWKRPDAAQFLARKLLDRLREIEASRLARGAPEDNRAAYNRQELVRKILADEADLTDPSFIPVLSALPRIDPSAPPSPTDLDQLAAALRTQFVMN